MKKVYSAPEAEIEKFTAVIHTLTPSWKDGLDDNDNYGDLGNGEDF